MILYDIVHPLSLLHYYLIPVSSPKLGTSELKSGNVLIFKSVSEPGNLASQLTWEISGITTTKTNKITDYVLRNTNYEIQIRNPLTLIRNFVGFVFYYIVFCLFLANISVSGLDNANPKMLIRNFVGVSLIVIPLISQVSWLANSDPLARKRRSYSPLTGVFTLEKSAGGVSFSVFCYPLVTSL